MNVVLEIIWKTVVASVLIFLIATIAAGGWQKFVRRRFPFQCPNCFRRYRNYYDGHDCGCGQINICNECVRFHVGHDEKRKADDAAFIEELHKLPDIACPRCGTEGTNGSLCATCERQVT